MPAASSSVQNYTWMSTDGQRTKWRKNIAKNFNRWVGRTSVIYRQTHNRRTDDDNSEREFTFAKNMLIIVKLKLM